MQGTHSQNTHSCARPCVTHG
ncbi:hypothetical protein F383_37020 [Gossypium arboreum]|uniref:Uncharacterized protein n=1 Tax=Gossypium arboreum TaxID=29729 RepID=A0A0B0MEE5_GOSAR|nr:hypothetical protein F383_37020 [Gossypium arboreum]